MATRVKQWSDVQSARYGVGPYDDYTDLDTGERCITDGISMVALQPYNMNYQIVQTEDTIVIAHEMYHEYRIIPLDDRPFVSDKITQWLGDASALGRRYTCNRIEKLADKLDRIGLGLEERSK